MNDEPKLKREIHRDYAALLRDPRWYQFCDGVKERKGDQCEDCGDTESPHQVHHLGYKLNALPWEYSDDEVLVACADCHHSIHKFADDLWNECLKCKNLWVIYEVLKKIRAFVASHKDKPNERQR